MLIRVANNISKFPARECFFNLYDGTGGSQSSFNFHSPVLIYHSPVLLLHSPVLIL